MRIPSASRLASSRNARLVALALTLATFAPKNSAVAGPYLIGNVRLENSPQTTTAEIQGVVADRIVLQEQGKTFVAQLPLDRVAEIEFLPTAEMTAGLEAIQSGEWAVASRALQLPANQIIPFLGVPETNAAPIIDAYAQALLELEQFDGLRRFYSKVVAATSTEAARTASAWLAYLDARTGKFSDLEATLEKIGAFESTEEGYALSELALSYARLAGGEFRAGGDHVAKIVANGDLATRFYPEALYLSGQCYDGLALERDARLAAERQVEVDRQMLSERVRVGRELQSAADKAGGEPPTEQEILAAVNRKAVESKVPAVPPRSENPFATTAQRLYRLIEQIYPDTGWSKKAGKSLSAEVTPTLPNSR